MKPSTPTSKTKSASASSSTPRVITAVIALPILIASILIPKLALMFVLLAAVAMVVALSEFWLLVGRRGVKAEFAAGYLASVSLFSVFYFVEPHSWPDLLMIQIILIVLTMGTLTAAMLRGAPFDKMIASVGATLLGVMYIGLLGGHLVATRIGFKEPLSAHLLSFFFMVLMGGDTAAYYVGRALGKHKLAPKVSPGKTWEGAVGGMSASLLMAVLAHFWFFRELPLKWALGLAAVMNILGVLGDLTESALKRGADAKDAANILPGHGGFLDRLDSLLFNAPLIYYFGRIYFR
ncbi:MAG: phosphatidate cytidylyltransferase [Pyrinomonadaceae bacterium]